jgi:hypothetical protein
MEAAFWLSVPLLILLGLYVFGHRSRRRRSKQDWEQMPTGAGYNPLQELIEPQCRHVVQVEDHAAKDDDQGAAD